MTWQTGSATNYLTLLQDLIDIATNSSVDSMAVNAGGSGYVVGDILTIGGGTAVGGHVAKAEVLTLSGSAVATVRISEGGAYTVSPGTGASTSGGSGSSCTIDCTIAANGWVIDRRTEEAVSATVTGGDAGTGYTVGDQLTIVLGDGAQGKAGVDAVFQVATITGGGGTGPVGTVTLVTAGNYEETPSNAAAITGGTGTDCELVVTYQTATTQDQVVVMHSTAPGSGYSNPYIAIETYQEVDQFLTTETCYNWALFGLTDFNSVLPLWEQAGVSIGHDTTAGDGGYLDRSLPNLPLKTTDGSYTLDFYFSITGRRILGKIFVTSSTANLHYPSFYMGYMNQAGTRLEFPYPMYIGGASWRKKAHWDETTPVIGGISMACGYNIGDADTDGQSSAYFYDSGNKKWYASLNFDFNDEGTTLNDDDTIHRQGLYPLISPYNDQDDETEDHLSVFGESSSAALEWFPELIDREIPPSPEAQLLPTPDGGDDAYLLVPLTVVGKWIDDGGPGSATQLRDVFGELDSCFYISAFPTADVSTLDTFLIGSDRYRVFQNGNQTDHSRSFMVIREE